MPVEMVLALLGKELDRAGEAVSGPHRRRHGEVVELGVEAVASRPSIGGECASELLTSR